MKIVINLILIIFNIVLMYKIYRLMYEKDHIEHTSSNDSLDICVLKDVDRRLKEEKEYVASLRKKEMESRVYNECIESIDNKHKETINNRTSILLETQQLAANIDYNLEKLAMMPFFKTYVKNGLYYTLAYVHGHYAAHYTETCLRFRISSKDDIQGMSDIYKDATKLSELRAFIEGKLIDIVEFHEFLPDFYESCLNELKGK